MIRDGLIDRYNGNVGSLEGMRVIRARIHWLCGNVKGPRVLDVGCSGGIAALILAREGHEVQGIDLQQSAIEKARELRTAEEERVQARLRFEVGEAGALPVDDGSYDTVLLGELLEHLTNIDRPLCEARRALVDGGQLLLTSPYGIWRSPDHKEPLYFDRLVLCLEAAGFAIREVCLIEAPVRTFFGLEASALPSGETPTTPWHRLAEVAESRVRQLDRLLEETQRELKAAHQQTKDLRQLEVDKRLEAVRAAKQQAADNAERKQQQAATKLSAVREEAKQKILAAQQEAQRELRAAHQHTKDLLQLEVDKRLEAVRAAKQQAADNAERKQQQAATKLNAAREEAKQKILVAQQKARSHIAEADRRAAARAAADPPPAAVVDNAVE